MPRRNEPIPQLENRKLRDLLPFPTQANVFSDCSPEDDAVFAQDIADHGLRHPIEVLPENEAGYPAGTIIKGHRRLKALLRLEQEEVEVLIRNDLADADTATIEVEFLDDNLIRRQLSPLGKARVAMRRYELECNRDPGELQSWEETEARERVGKAIGMSGRNAQRYFNVLRAPLAVQEAFDAGAISLVQAEKVGALPTDIQRKIDKRIRDGEEAKLVVSDYTADPNQRPKSRGAIVTHFIRAADKANSQLAGTDLADYVGSLRPGEQKVLKQLNKNCVTLLKANRAREQKVAGALAKAADLTQGQPKSAVNADGHDVRRKKRKSKT